MKPAPERWAAYAFLILLTCAVTGCGGGGDGGNESSDDLVVIQANVAGQAEVPLNVIIEIEFSGEVLASSVTPETIRIRRGPTDGIQVPGTFEVEGARVRFFAQLPTRPDLEDAGLAPGHGYSIQIIGGEAPNRIRSATGDPLCETFRALFSTAGELSPNLFTDHFITDDPRVSGLTPEGGATDVPQATSIEIEFTEPLLPATVTANHIQLLLIERPAGVPLASARSIPGSLELEQDHEAAVVTFHPDYPLADNAKYVITVDRKVTDLVGNDLVPYEAEFTLRDELPIPGAFALTFGEGTEIHRDGDATTASWNEDREGAAQAVYSFGGGDGVDGDFRPITDTTLNGNAQMNGIYNFRSFEIPADVTVHLTGDNPITIRSLASMKIRGTLDLSGLQGADSELNSSTAAVPPTLGGEGGPGGGRGGDVATNVPTSRTYNYGGNVGQDGGDGHGTTGTGGGAATWGSKYNYKSGAGGGGGGHVNPGQAGKPSTNTSSIRRGVPGKAGEGDDNDDPSRLTGGAGGGAGMNGWYYYTPRSHGAGAGGGGGGLALECARDIELAGTILADGGDGGNVVMGTNSYSSAGGGAGAGGTVVARATGDISLGGATVSAVGGQGGVGGKRYGGDGGDGSDGRVRFEDSDGIVDTSGSTMTPFPEPEGVFAPTSGAATVAQTVWLYLGVFDPEFAAPRADDLQSTTPLPGQEISVQVQMAREDPDNLGHPDPFTASPWTDIADIETLNGNGYGLVRVRISFLLADGQKIGDPLPYLSRVRLRYVH